MKINFLDKGTNIMTVSLSNAAYYIDTENLGKYLVIPLEYNTSIGKNLTCSNGGIRIGKGISKVLVSGQILFDTNQTDLYLRVLKNDCSASNLDKNTLVYINDSYSTGIGVYKSLNVGGLLCDVQEGDIIYLATYPAMEMTISSRNLNIGTCTYLTVQAV